MAQVEQAIAAARHAFDSGPWPTAEPAERARCLQQLSDALLARGDEIYALAQAEWGCTANERLIHVEGPAVHGRARRGARARTRRGADGRLGRGRHHAAALRAARRGGGDDAVELPPHHQRDEARCGAGRGKHAGTQAFPLTPIAGLALARIIDEETDIPPGVVNVVTPTSVEASKVLTLDPRVDMVSFTGSSAVGRDVMAGAATTMKRILLECGGKSASIFLDDVDVTDELLERVLFEGCTMHAGQACILNSRLLLPDSIHDDVVGRLAELARNVAGRRSTRPGRCDGAADQRRTPATASRVSSSARKVMARRWSPADVARRTSLAASYFEPTILTDVTAESFIAQEEVFGPVLTVLRYRDDDDAVAIANNSAYGLGGAVWGATSNRARRGRATDQNRPSFDQRHHCRRRSIRRLRAERHRP